MAKKNTPAQQGEGDDMFDRHRDMPGAGGDDVRGIADEEGEDVEGGDEMDDLEADEEDVRR